MNLLNFVPNVEVVKCRRAVDAACAGARYCAHGREVLHSDLVGGSRVCNLRVRESQAGRAACKEFLECYQGASSAVLGTTKSFTVRHSH